MLSQAEAYKRIAAALVRKEEFELFIQSLQNNKLQQGKMLRIAAMVTVALLLVGGRSPASAEAEQSEASMLCVSKCDTCPTVCSPPKASGGAIPSPPSLPQNSSSSSSYPYYYFYTAGADRAHGMVFGFLGIGLLPLLVLSFVIVEKK